MRYDEVAAGAITHALRFTCPVTRSSNPATDVAIREPEAPVEIHVFCSATTDLGVYAGKPPREVRLDQGLVTAPQGGGLISFEHLAKGEHVVSLSY